MNPYVVWGMIVVGSGVVLWLSRRTVVRARELNRRIEEYHREQDELEKSGKVIDPYAGLAENYQQDERKRDKRKRV